MFHQPLQLRLKDYTMDAVYLGITLAFFVLSYGLIALNQRLRGE
jgi:hypothetical protein